MFHQNWINAQKRIYDEYAVRNVLVAGPDDKMIAFLAHKTALELSTRQNEVRKLEQLIEDQTPEFRERVAHYQKRSFA